MRRLKVRYRPEAISDIEDIHQHIYRVSFSPLIANGLVQRILDRCGRIGDAPIAAGRATISNPAFGRSRLRIKQ